MLDFFFSFCIRKTLKTLESGNEMRSDDDDDAAAFVLVGGVGAAFACAFNGYEANGNEK